MRDNLSTVSRGKHPTCFLMRNLLAPTMTSSYPEDGIKQLNRAKQPLNDCIMSSMLMCANKQLPCALQLFLGSDEAGAASLEGESLFHMHPLVPAGVSCEADIL